MMLLSPICESLLTVQWPEAYELAERLEVSLNNFDIMSSVLSKQPALHKAILYNYNCHN